MFYSALGPRENLLSGAWIDTPEGLKPDRTCERIDALTGNHLTALGADPSGWNRLYRDPATVVIGNSRISRATCRVAVRRHCGA